MFIKIARGAVTKRNLRLSRPIPRQGGEKEDDFKRDSFKMWRRVWLLDDFEKTYKMRDMKTTFKKN